MRITIESTLLASSDPAVGRVGPSGLTLNGRQIVDDAEFYQAAAATVFARDNLGTVLQFSVQCLFSTIKAAERFALLHAGEVPRSGVVTAVCGESGDTLDAYLEGAAVEGVSILEVRGTAVRVQYTIRGGVWTSDVPDDLPGESDETEDFIIMRRGQVTIGNGDDEVDVTFSAPLGALPSISFNVAVPTGGVAIGGTLLQDTITTNGFTVRLDAATPNGDYVLHYQAFE